VDGKEESKMVKKYIFKNNVASLHGILKYTKGAAS
jgi:hypothetical protein